MTSFARASAEMIEATKNWVDARGELDRHKRLQAYGLPSDVLSATSREMTARARAEAAQREYAKHQPAPAAKSVIAPTVKPAATISPKTSAINVPAKPATPRPQTYAQARAELERARAAYQVADQAEREAHHRAVAAHNATVKKA